MMSISGRILLIVSACYFGHNFNLSMDLNGINFEAKILSVIKFIMFVGGRKLKSGAHA